MCAPDVASRLFCRQQGERSRQFSPRLRTQEVRHRCQSSSSQMCLHLGEQGVIISSTTASFLFRFKMAVGQFGWSLQGTIDIYVSPYSPAIIQEVGKKWIHSWVVLEKSFLKQNLIGCFKSKYISSWLNIEQNVLPNFSQL